MKSLHEVQQHARDLIAADAYLVGQTVVAELGLGDADREAALRERGVCVSVLPLDEGRFKSQGKGVAAIEASVFVLTEVNPRVNADQAQKDIYQVLKAVQGALLGYDPTNPNDRYRTGERAFDYSDHDPGLLSYIQVFQKLCAY